MRRRRRSIIAFATVAMSLSAPVGNASLEDDCYFAGGYFGAGYFAADYFDETCGAPPSPPADQANTRQKTAVIRGVSMN